MSQTQYQVPPFVAALDFDMVCRKYGFNDVGGVVWNDSIQPMLARQAFTADTFVDIPTGKANPLYAHAVRHTCIVDHTNTKAV